MTEKEFLRKEHNERVQSGFLKSVLGNTCVNCGATENIEYHHIVPICVGGTNKLSNIVPVCYRCHKAIHGEKDYREYKISLRMKEEKIPINKYDDDIERYINCKITKDELLYILGVKNLSSNKYYRHYLESHGIKMVINNVSKMIETLEYPPAENKAIGYIVYKSGKVENVLYTTN